MTSKNQQQVQPAADTFSQKWTKALQSLTQPMLSPILALSSVAARNPKRVVFATIIFSIAIAFIGLVTNFTSETDDDIWTPQGSKPLEHGNWIDDDSNFPVASRNVVIIVHRDGKNLFDDDMAWTSTQRLFESLDHFRATPRYDELCQMLDYTNPATGEQTCQIVGASTYWNDTTAVFESEIQSDEDALTALSSTTYPLGGPVHYDQIIGFNKFDDSGILNYGESFVTVLFLPPDSEDSDDFKDSFSADFEEDAIDRMLDLQDQWAKNDEFGFRVEIITDRSFEDEFTRAVTKDMPLLPLVFVLMSVLCVILFARRDKVLSRSWLGFGAVVTVLLAIMASFGLLFAIGVPFTSLTPLLPFIMFGVGLDDAFIISGAYARTDHTKSAVDRISDTMHDIGHTIMLTTLTSSLAFALGLISSIPAVRYLVLYAFPTILIDFVFQITFFVALIVIDQKRIEENRKDCCFCCTAKDVSEASTLDMSGKGETHFADRLMIKYANFLLKPAVKYFVLVLFTAMLGFFSWRTSLLTQYFDFTDVIPADSYIQTWWTAYQDNYEANGVRAGVYFRFVDFSDESVQEQMESYVQELAAMPFAGRDEPADFWLRDFKEFITDDSVSGLTFNEQVQKFLEDPVFYDTYSEDIVLDENGVMTTSRTLIRMDNLDDEDVIQTVDFLELQRSISKNQPINEGRDEWAFFTFAEDYYIQEFYAVSPDELALTTIIGTVTVSVLALVFIPHWSAILFVGPIVAILYIDLLGFIELAGIHVNPVMYISTVMSIGLMVDFVMHVILRYVETKGKTREEKTTETLGTIGASVMIGGFSTLIGVLPLALSSSEIFYTTFIIFFGLVFLGLLHGLVLLPVLLSMFGPLGTIELEAQKEEADKADTDAGSAIGFTKHETGSVVSAVDC